MEHMLCQLVERVFSSTVGLQEVAQTFNKTVHSAIAKSDKSINKSV